MNVLPVKTTIYGSNSVIPCAVRDWNNLLNKIDPMELPDLIII